MRTSDGTWRTTDTTDSLFHRRRRRHLPRPPARQRPPHLGRRPRRPLRQRRNTLRQQQPEQERLRPHRHPVHRHRPEPRRRLRPHRSLRRRPDQPGRHLRRPPKHPTPSTSPAGWTPPTPTTAAPRRAPRAPLMPPKTETPRRRRRPACAPRRGGTDEETSDGRGRLGKDPKRAAERAKQLAAIAPDWNCPWPLTWQRHYRVLTDRVHADDVLPYIAPGATFEGDDIGTGRWRQQEPDTWPQLPEGSGPPVVNDRACAGRTPPPTPGPSRHGAHQAGQDRQRAAGARSCRPRRRCTAFRTPAARRPRPEPGR